MPINFPSNPSEGDTFEANTGTIYRYDNNKWVSAVPDPNYADIQGATGPQGTKGAKGDKGDTGDDATLIKYSAVSPTGASYTFTDIPGDWQKITVVFNRLGNGNGLLVRLGTNSTMYNSGYTSTSSEQPSGANANTNNTTGWYVHSTSGGTVGSMEIYKMTSTAYISNHTVAMFNGLAAHGAGRLGNVSGTITRLQLRRAEGGNFASPGSVRILV